MYDGLTAVGRTNLWQQPLYARVLPQVDPFDSATRQAKFRALHQAYDGNNTFWATPSPEPPLPDSFWAEVSAGFDNPSLAQAAAALAAALAAWEPQTERLLFIAILRAGVPIADWLTRLLPGSQAVAMSMFVGVGVDPVALQQLQQACPDKRLVFVDGWTGRGGVSRALHQLGVAPLAVLIDPWGWADFAGWYDDLFCPTACFTGPATLGFSRTFYTAEDEMFATYLFPESYAQPQLIARWQQLCPSQPTTPLASSSRFFKETDLRLHSNEVCRALINANPTRLYFRADAATAQQEYGLLLALAEERHVPVDYQTTWLSDYQTNVAATLSST